MLFVPGFLTGFCLPFDGLEQVGYSLVSWCSSRTHPSKEIGREKQSAQSETPDIAELVYRSHVSISIS